MPTAVYHIKYIMYVVDGMENQRGTRALIMQDVTSSENELRYSSFFTGNKARDEMRMLNLKMTLGDKSK